MDTITTSLQEFLKCAGLNYYTQTKTEHRKNLTATVIEISTAFERASEVRVDINPKNYLIRISVNLQNKININNLKVIQNCWDKEGRLTRIELSGKHNNDYDLQIIPILSCNIISDARGLTRTLWKRYFEYFLSEMSQFCKYTYFIENITDNTNSSYCQFILN